MAVKKSSHLFILVLGLLIFYMIIGVSLASEKSDLENLVNLSLEDYEGLEYELPELKKNSTISDFLKYAALNNPGLRAAFNRWKSSLEKIPQVRSLPDPRFNYGYFVSEVETRVGPQNHKIGLSQMFPWFGKLGLRAEVAFQQSNVQREKYESAKLKLFYQVKEAYFELYYISRAIDITEKNMRLLSYFEEVARSKYQVGSTGYSFIIKAQVELGKLEDQLRALKDFLNPVKARLNTVLNRAPREPLPIPVEIPVDRISFTDTQLFQWLRETNPELKAIGFMAEKEKFAMRLAKKDYYPDITVGMDYVITGDSIMADTEDTGKDPFMAMVSINLPIWREKYSAAEKEAAARYQANIEARIDRENSLISQIEMVLYRYRDSERKIDLYRDTLIPKAEQSLVVTKQAFIADHADFLDLIDAERTLLEFQLSYERALANRAQRLAELEKLIGKTIPRGD